MCFGRSLKGEQPDDLTSAPIQVIGSEKTSSHPIAPSNAPLSAEATKTSHSEDASKTDGASTASRPKQGYNSFLGVDQGAMRGQDFAAMGASVF